MAQNSFGMLITWEMATISFMWLSTRYRKTGVSWWITSSMSSPHFTLSQELCSNRISAFRVENSSANGFDPLWAGPNATKVPKEAITVDNDSPDIVFSDRSMWITTRGALSFIDTQVYEGSLARTTQPSASLSFSFDGVAIWYNCVFHA